MTIHLALTNEDGIWVAQSIEFDVASQGDTPEQAISMWRGAAAIFIEELGHLPSWQTVEVELDVP